MANRSLPFGALFLIAALPLAAQTGDAPQAVASDTVQVNLVEVPVNVFDRKGNAIRGLSPENFELYDDGKRRKITHFEEIDLAQIATGEPEFVSPAARRNFMIVFDLTNSGQVTIDRAKTAAREFLRDFIQPRDLASVATFSVEGGFTILTSFTTDRELLDLAVRNIGNPRFLQRRDPLLLASSVDPGLMEGAAGEENPTQQDVLAAEQEARAIHEALRIQMQQQDQRYARARIETQLRTFAGVARMLDRVSGRKQIILLTEGFDSALVQGRQEAMDATEATALLRGEIWKFDSDYRFGSHEALRELGEMGRLFRRSDVVLHAIDIRGLRGPSDTRSGAQLRSAATESLFLLTDPTGGTAFKNQNDLAASFARMLKQQEVVYILGFQTEPSGNPGRFHDLKVEVRVVGHSGLRVSHRAGYYEPHLQMNAVEQLLSATDILMNDIPFEEVETNVLATAFPSAEGEFVVPIVLEIDGESLLQRVAGDTLNAEMFVYAFDRSNVVKDYIFQTVSLDLRSLRETLGGSGLKYYGTISLAPGDYTIKTLIRVVESGMKGFQRIALNVPRRGDPAILPPLFFEEQGKWILLRGASKAGLEVEYPFVIAEESFIPSARPLLSGDQVQKLALFTYNVDPEDIGFSAVVRDPAGAAQNASLKLVGRTPQDEYGGVKLLLEFDPQQLASGNYLFDVTLLDPDGGRGQTVSIPFALN